MSCSNFVDVGSSVGIWVLLLGHVPYHVWVWTNPVVCLDGWCEKRWWFWDWPCILLKFWRYFWSETWLKFLFTFFKNSSVFLLSWIPGRFCWFFSYWSVSCLYTGMIVSLMQSSCLWFVFFVLNVESTMLLIYQIQMNSPISIGQCFWSC